MSELSVDTAIRLARLQQRVFRCIEDELRKDGHHKSYEGAIDVTLCLPNIFEQERGTVWIITLNAYVLPTEGRHASWRGKTLVEALAAAEAGLESMFFDYEMERMSKDLECVDEEGETDGSTVLYGDTRHEADARKATP